MYVNAQHTNSLKKEEEFSFLGRTHKVVRKTTYHKGIIELVPFMLVSTVSDSPDLCGAFCSPDFSRTAEMGQMLLETGKLQQKWVKHGNFGILQ